MHKNMNPRPKRGQDVRPLQLRLPASLIKELRHHAVEAEKSLSTLAEEAFSQYLAKVRTERKTKTRGRSYTKCGVKCVP